MQSSARSGRPSSEPPADPDEPRAAEAQTPVELAERLQPALSQQRAKSMQVAFALAMLLVGLGVVFLIRDVIGAFVLGALLAFLILPGVDLLSRRGMPRPLAILLLFVGVVLVFAGLLSIFVPVISQEVSQLQSQGPALATTAQARLSSIEGQPLNIYGMKLDLARITQQINLHFNEFLLGQFGNALSLGLAALGTMLQIVLMLIVAFLLAMDAHRVTNLLRSLTPTAYRDDFDIVWEQVKSMLYSYMRGQLIIASLIGIFCGAAVQLLGIKYAIALGLLAAITSLVPYLGPFLGAIPAILIALATSPQEAILVAIAYFVISNLILNFVYPKVVGDAVRLPPILVIVAFIAGFSLAGILGMFIAVPVAATVRILYDHIHPRLFGTAA